MKTSTSAYLGEPFDCSEDFYSIGNTYFNISEMTEFDDRTLSGRVSFKRYTRKSRTAFNGGSYPFEKSSSWCFPPDYPDNPDYPVKLTFYEDNILRIRMNLGTREPEQDSLMLSGEMKETAVKIEKRNDGVMLAAEKIAAEIAFEPFSIKVIDQNGKCLTKTLNLTDGECLLNCNPLPFSYVRRTEDMKKYAAASFSVSYDEHFYGCGESFTGLDKRGTKTVLWTKDPHGAETREMYKPIPFYLSSKGYGIFTHTSAPVTFDFGYNYQEAQTIFIGEDIVDLFVITGTPKEILKGYTSLTGRSTVPPLWSFGLWMSRITYKSEEEVRATARKLRDFRIPCDVIHLDTGWFEQDWRCNYKFSQTRFSDPEKMLKDLKDDGFHISLWQIPYFTPGNELYREIIEKRYAVSDGAGGLPTDDAILDFSNQEAVAWYQRKLQKLLDMGVSAIKADFGEAAPLHGSYASGKPGMLEHNLYPLRYNKAVSDITKARTGASIIWARSAWAGSQRYPLHWGGDAENTNMGMLCSLRGGLSLGMSGFSFWSHDAGGFVHKSPEELYQRWMFMSIFSSHIRCHGAPPKEPWNYSAEFLSRFRSQVNFRYQLLPYIYKESKISAENGWPLMRAMFFEFPDDKTCLELEDQYMFGESILVAPLFEDYATERAVYLPEGSWVDIENKESVYQGGRWHKIRSGTLSGIALVKKGSRIQMAELAQNTKELDWNKVRNEVF